eukprot:5157185-Amphidinium_carterae.1
MQPDTSEHVTVASDSAPPTQPSTASGSHDPTGDQRTVATTTRAQKVPRPGQQGSPKTKVVLVYHGSFAPLHIGHVECLVRALALLKKHHVTVAKVVVGFTTAKQVGEKAPGSGLTDIQVRTNVAKDVLSLANLGEANVTVDGHEYGKASELAAAHHDTTATALYLVGSDVTKKPARETLIVTRTKAEVSRYSTGEFFDHKELMGVCFQTKAFSVSSTWVRQVLLDKRMPLFYSINAQDIICTALRLKRRTVAQAVATNVSPAEQPASGSGASHDVSTTPAAMHGPSQADGSQVIMPTPTPVSAVATGRSAEAAVPRSKAMPKRITDVPPQTERRRYGADVHLRAAAEVLDGNQESATHREPLPRRRPSHIVVDRPPLRRRRAIEAAAGSHDVPSVVEDGATDVRLTTQTDGPSQRALALATLDIPVPPLAHLLTTPGIMKVQPPARSNLQVFWSSVVIPLCQLLAVTPFLLARRAQDAGVLRISYFPQVCPPIPFMAFIDTHQMADFYHNLAEVAERVVNCVWISMHFEGLTTRDLDVDTNRGMAMQQMLRSAVLRAEKRSLLSSYPACFAMMRVPNLVIIGRPAYAVQAEAIVDEAVELINCQLDIARTRLDDPPQFKMLADYAHTTFVSGGGGGKRKTLPGDLEIPSQGEKRHRAREPADAAIIDLSTPNVAVCNSQASAADHADEAGAETCEVEHAPNASEVEDIFRDVQSQPRSSNHILAFHAALTARDPTGPDAQRMVHMLEEAILNRSIATKPTATAPIMQSIMQADRDIGDWANEGQLRRDFIRGMMLDLFLLAELFDVGITVLDCHGHARLHLCRPSVICLQADADALVFAVVGILLHSDVVVSGLEIARRYFRSQTQIEWQYKAQCVIASLLFSHPPALWSPDSSSASSSSSLSSTLQCISQGLAGDELRASNTPARIVQGGAFGLRGAKRKRLDTVDDMPSPPSEEPPPRGSWELKFKLRA